MVIYNNCIVNSQFTYGLGNNATKCDVSIIIFRIPFHQWKVEFKSAGAISLLLTLMPNYYMALMKSVRNVLERMQ